ncbi:hypothetical protein BP00DRAFT_86799 [Aspergillus indologenus CBS 114.80]|uniref:Uncharacterized protein n=1 Tax=Aspergillus indologenus CBS 114.80 TaxID=1450541 RepID=A0A2V5IPF1_9EURO|nr:hypothetical protein BP00DRAFT_86799 [Aspergillus indologenus CBS 114.80]
MHNHGLLLQKIITGLNLSVITAHYLLACLLRSCQLGRRILFFSTVGVLGSPLIGLIKMECPQICCGPPFFLPLVCFSNLPSFTPGLSFLHPLLVSWPPINTP